MLVACKDKSGSGKPRGRGKEPHERLLRSCSLRSPAPRTALQRAAEAPAVLGAERGSPGGRPPLTAPGPPAAGAERSPGEEHPSEPPPTELAMKKTENDHTLVLIVDVKANKHQTRQAEKKLCDTDVAKANDLIRPDG
uniref:60S ribosomal protein L23a-like n=1 Tax=Jaculus jaculus TaxID=51337 RepID=UPI001E1B58D7|nr:60S ribosomal protein L23a-like [Jaculus jaculus]